MKRVLAHGTFDIIHYGHLNYLENAKALGDYLVVLVTSDKLAKKNGKNPYFNEKIRIRMIESLKVVDEVILRDCDITEQTIKNLKIDIFATVSNNFEYLNKYCKIVKLKRTQEISTTKIKEHILNTKDLTL